MKKIIIKESEKVFLGIDIMLYTIYATIGYILIDFPEVNMLNPIEYAPVLFFMFGFFSIVAYFLNRRVDDYEYLFFGLINVMVATYVLTNQFYGNDSLIMSCSIIIYSISIVLNKLYHVSKLAKRKDINFYPKMISTILIVLIGILALDPLITRYAAASLILGYYFISFGLINLLEILFMVLIKNPKLDKKLCCICGIEDKKDNKKKKVVLKEIKRKKIKKNIKE